jgi:hypothetical protein
MNKTHVIFGTLKIKRRACIHMLPHTHCSFEPHLPVEVGFDAATCPTAPELASLLK